MVGLRGRAGIQCEAADHEFVVGHAPPPRVTLPQGRTVGHRHHRVAGSSNIGVLHQGRAERQGDL